MTENPGLLLTAFAFIIAIGVLVFVHEMGHYLVGRFFGVKADVFSIGFGKELTGWNDKRGTRWKICALPLGGYVQFAGDMDPSSKMSDEYLSLPAAEQAKTFQSKSLWKRALIVFAGPAINFIFAILILAGFAYAYGESVTPTVVDSVVAGSAAEQYGIKPGDRIVKIDDRELDTFNQMAREVSIIPGEDVTFNLVRDGLSLSLPVKIGTRLEVDRFGNEFKVGQLGIKSTTVEVRPVSLLEAPVVATRKTSELVSLIVRTLGQVISGRRSIKEMGGPLKIAQVSGEQFAAGLENYIYFIAFISINLGFINLLPIPMLDGGHLMFYAIEAIQRKPPGPKVQEWAFRSGFALLMTFMIFVTFNDLSSFGLF